MNSVILFKTQHLIFTIQIKIRGISDPCLPTGVLDYFYLSTKLMTKMKSVTFKTKSKFYQ